MYNLYMYTITDTSIQAYNGYTYMHDLYMCTIDIIMLIIGICM